MRYHIELLWEKFSDRHPVLAFLSIYAAGFTVVGIGYLLTS